MIAEPKTGTRAKPESRVVLRRLLVVVLGLAILAVGANVAWWLIPPALEPLPSVTTGGWTRRSAI